MGLKPQPKPTLAGWDQREAAGPSAEEAPTAPWPRQPQPRCRNFGARCGVRPCSEAGETAALPAACCVPGWLRHPRELRVPRLRRRRELGTGRAGARGSEAAPGAGTSHSESNSLAKSRILTKTRGANRQTTRKSDLFCSLDPPDSCLLSDPALDFQPTWSLCLK